MNAFSRLHPAVLFVYLMTVIVFSSFVSHPVFLLIMLFCSLFSAILAGGRNFLKTLFFPILPTALLAAALNPLFNHGGETVLAYFASGNPLTLESVLFGIYIGAMLICVMAWFSCFNAVMTSDKLLCVFSRLSPSAALILSMALRFVPRFSDRLSEVRRVQRTESGKTAGICAKIKREINIFMAMLTWALENAVITSDSMLARGFGTKRRTSYSNFTFSRRDAEFLAFFAVFAAYILIGAFCGRLSFSFFPRISGTETDLFTVSLYCGCLFLGLMPAFAEASEVRKWRI